jgi:hypothetical protein
MHGRRDRFGHWAMHYDQRMRKDDAEKTVLDAVIH